MLTHVFHCKLDPFSEAHGVRTSQDCTIRWIWYRHMTTEEFGRDRHVLNASPTKHEYSTTNVFA